MIESQTHGYWRSLAELADAGEICDSLQHEFTAQADQWPEDANRREFLKLMGASLSLAGLHGCSQQPEEQIVPYIRNPEGIVPGEPLEFATTLPIGGDVIGVLVKSIMGRPIKIEGNALHPASRGATSAMAQAALLTLYDPDRSQAVKQLETISTWDAFVTVLREKLKQLQGRGSSGLRLLSGTITSPTLLWQMEKFLEVFSQAKWHQYEPNGADNTGQGAQLAFGSDLQPIYHLDRADIVLALDADFLGTGMGHVRYARDFSDRRRVRPGLDQRLSMNRLYAVESTPTITGAAADHRLPLKPAEIEQFAWALAQRLGAAEADELVGPPMSVPTSWWDSLIDDLQNYGIAEEKAAPLVVPGLWTTPRVQALAHRINAALGSIGTSVSYIEPLTSGASIAKHTLAELVEDMEAKKVELLIILSGNPVYDAPVDLDFAQALEKVPFRAHYSLYEDETSQHCHWHLPATHSLESWSDARAFDGTASIIQPLIAPLYDGRTKHELLAAIIGSTERSSYEIVRAYWKQVRESEADQDFDDSWLQSLHDGVISNSAPRPVERALDGGITFSPASQSNSKYQLLFRPDPSVWDGSLANNGWLQELPNPFTKLTWDNAALVSPALAEELELENEQIVELVAGERHLLTPVLIVPGQAASCITLHLGYGRTQAGTVGSGCGFDAYQLRTNASPWVAESVEIRKTPARYPLARTQHHHLMDGRDLIRAGTLKTLKQSPEHPGFMAQGHHGEETSFYPEFEYEGRKWGMSVDLTTCTGCNACVVACQAENNIPIVGKQQVGMGREMHWLRIDQYYHGDSSNPTSYHQPVMCMHCENAPCEVVCPVAATVHTEEGLNAMVYNRCVGTRYCSNNCPYKVRRFNFLQYSDQDTPVLKLLRNPEVTVRNRGVMEKCTYCIQRISAARIEAEVQGSAIVDIATACQAACPSQAIVFGDLNDKESRVAKLQESPLNYTLLDELNTKPRTTYLAEVRNPNPTIT